MTSLMPEWVHNKDAGFALAAYAVAAVALLGTLIASLREYRRRVRAWATLSQKEPADREGA